MPMPMPKMDRKALRSCKYMCKIHGLVFASFCVECKAKEYKEALEGQEVILLEGPGREEGDPTEVQILIEARKIREQWTEDKRYPPRDRKIYSNKDLRIVH